MEKREAPPHWQPMVARLAASFLVILAFYWFCFLRKDHQAATEAKEVVGVVEQPHE